MKDIEHTFVRQIMALMYARWFCLVIVKITWYDFLKERN